MPANNKQTYKLMFVTGEASGDQYAAQLVTELKKLSANYQYSGMGMSAMHKAGVNLIVNSKEIAVTGLFEVIRYYPHIRKRFMRLKASLIDNRPDLLILVDYPDFNLTLAKTARKLSIKMLFYISPQVWAWRRKRIQKIAQLVDALVVILPFEQDLYRNTGLPVYYYGHPLIDEVEKAGILSYKQTEKNHSDNRRHILLLPGSRQVEVRRHLPIIVAAAVQMQQQHPHWHFSLLIAEGLDATAITEYITQKKLVCEITRDTYPAMATGDFAITCSGTASLQLALCQVPMVVVYKLSFFTYFLLKNFIKLKYISLPNIILDKPIVPELIQQQLTPEAICNETFAILDNPEQWNATRSHLTAVANQLGESGVSKRIAMFICQMLKQN